MKSLVALPAQRDQVQPGVLGEQMPVAAWPVVDLRRWTVAQYAEPSMNL